MKLYFHSYETALVDVGLIAVAFRSFFQSTLRRDVIMYLPASNRDDAVVRPAMSIGRRSIHGAFWTLVCTLLTKCLTLASQIALAYYLVPDEIGLVAMTFSVTHVFGFVLLDGMWQVLVQRGDRFGQDCSQAFWLSTLMGFIACGLACCLAPLIATACGEARLGPLIVAAALSWPLASPAVVYMAKLQLDLRARAVAWVYFGKAIMVAGGSVILAAAGYGSLSLVLPLIPGNLLMLVAMRLLAGRLTLQSPAPSQWLELLIPSTLVRFVGLTEAIGKYGLGIIIGTLQGPHVAGLFFWGFTLSMQLVYVFGVNLQNVLFPAFARLNADTDRLWHAYLQSARVLLCVMGIFCILQLLCAREIVGLLFNEQWAAAAVVVRWLSVGAFFQPIIFLSRSLLLARGNLVLSCVYSGISAMCLLAALSVVALHGSLAHMAIIVAICTFVSAVIIVQLVARTFDKKAIELAYWIAAPLGAVTLAGLAGVFTRWSLADRGLLALGLATVVTVTTTYVIAIALFTPSLIHELSLRASPKLMPSDNQLPIS